MNVDNVYEHQSAVWSRLKRNATNEQKHMADARALWPVIAVDMAKLRGDYPSNIEFGAALVLHEIDFNEPTRAAFIHLGNISDAALTDAMELNPTRSPRLLSLWVKDAAKTDYYYDAVVLTSCKNADPIPETPDTPPETTETSDLKKPETPVHGNDDSDERVFYDYWDNRESRTNSMDIARAYAKKWAAGTRINREMLRRSAARIRAGHELVTAGMNGQKVIPVQWFCGIVPDTKAHMLNLQSNKGKFSSGKEYNKTFALCDKANDYDLTRDKSAHGVRLTLPEWMEHVEGVKPMAVAVQSAAPLCEGEKRVVINNFQIWPKDDAKYSYVDLCHALYVGQFFATAALTGNAPTYFYVGNMMAHAFKHFIYGDGFIEATQSIGTKLQMPGFGSTPLINNNSWHEGITSKEIESVVGVSKIGK